MYGLVTMCALIMREKALVEQLSNLYGFDMDEALILTGLDCNDNNDNNNENTSSEKYKYDKNLAASKCRDEIEEMVKPFDGIVKQNCCKAVVYNHGLYTQCTNVCSREFCSSVCKKLKYGHINVRKNYPVGAYVLENGKREISYQKVKKRLEKKERNDKNVSRIITNDSDTEDEETIELSVVKNARGRPKMSSKDVEIQIDTSEKNDDKLEEDDDSNIEEVLVRRETIDGKEYLVSDNNIVYDSKSLKMIGRKINGKVKSV